MTQERLLDCVPPCGLMCYTCPGFRDGAIQEHSTALYKLREGFCEFLESRLPEDKRYIIDEHHKYVNKLKRDSSPGCPGCRKIDGKSPGCIQGCFIPQCAKEHGVDFCGECNAFPCDKIQKSDLYDKETKKGFYDGSMLIKEHGVEKFFEMRKDISHYINYKK